MPGQDLELNDLRLPYDIMAEQCVLGAMLIDETIIPKVMEKLKPDDFYMRQNRDIFTTMFTMYNQLEQKIDHVTVMDRMKRSGLFDKDSTISYIQQLMILTPSAENGPEYAGIVADKALLRRIGETALELVELVRGEKGTSDQILEAAEQRIYAIRQGKAGQSMSHITTVLSEVYDNLKRLQAQGGEFPGISTGLIDLDRKISGLNNSDLIILAARPAMGKSSLAMNIAVEAAKNSGKSVAVFSLEMSKLQLGMRLLATESLIDNKKLSTGRIVGEAEWGRLAMAAAALSQAKLYLDDNATLSVADINAKCRRIEDLGLVVIDYLQLMNSAGGPVRASDNRQQIVADMSRSLKLMAKELDVPVICLSQLSRDNEKRGAAQRKPVLSDLRDSGAIEQDADIVLFLYRESYYDEDADNANLALCNVAKNRHGETGDVELEWRPEFTLFRNLSHRDDDEEL